MPKDSLYEDFSATVERKCEDHGQREREVGRGHREGAEAGVPLALPAPHFCLLQGKERGSTGVKTDVGSCWANEGAKHLTKQAPFPKSLSPILINDSATLNHF